MTTYKRLKKENADLKKMLILLANEPDTIEGIIIKNKYIMLKKYEDAVMAGNIDDKVFYGGLLARIKPNVG